MITKRSKIRGVAALAVAGAALLSMVGSAPSASADPKWPTAIVGHGSDTTQDIMGALGGEESGLYYTPVQSSVASGARNLNSWDATGTPCVTPRANGIAIDRGNGSSNGRRILSRAIDGGNWGTAACGVRNPSGLVDFARSSSGPSGSGTALTYIPFGRDALSFAYVANGVTPVTTLTSAQLAAIMTTDGGINVGGTQVVACGIQTGSGTYQSWNSMNAISAANEAIGTADCNAAGTGVYANVRCQESDGACLKNKSDSQAGVQVIIGYSAGNYIAQNNGVVATQLPAPAGTVVLGAIDALGVPYVGTPGSTLTPSSTFYASTTFGRDVYNVLSTTILTGPGNNHIKTMFVGTTSGVCSATTTIQAFGFLSLGANCGSTTLQGPLVA